MAVSSVKGGSGGRLSDMRCSYVPIGKIFTDWYSPFRPPSSAQERGEHIGGAMFHWHAVDQDDVADRVAGAQGQDRLVGRRSVPGAGAVPIGKLDDDQVARPIALQPFRFVAMNQEAAAKRRERGVDPFQISDD